MKITSPLLRFALIALASAHGAYAQSAPTATQQLQFSVFVASTDTLTKLAGGKNVDTTAGVDLAFLTFRLFKPFVEVRGTYPIDKGNVTRQKNFLVGPRVEYPLGRLHPYVNFLVGRGKIDYNAPGFAFGNTMYVSSTTMVYSPGAGLDYNVIRNLSVKTDLQFQHWSTPATVSGTINPTALTLGIVYNFDLNPRHRHDR
jgi:opacity protein-like surface antigen